MIPANIILSVLSSKIFQYGAAIALVLLALTGLYWKGHSDGYSVCDAAHKAAAAAEVVRETKVGQKVTADSVAKTAADKAIDAANGDIVARAVARVRSMPPLKTETVTITAPMPTETSYADAVCVPADVVDQLRSLR